MVIVRRANASDSQIVGFIHYTAWRQAYKDIFPRKYLDEDSAKKRSEMFIQSLGDDNIIFYLVYVREKAVGIACIKVDDENIEIVSLYVLHEYRNKGCGSYFFDFLKNEWKNKSLFLFVLEINTSAIAFYEHKGFRYTGNQREIYRGKTYVQLLYKLENPG